MILRDYMKTLDAEQKEAFAKNAGTSIGYLRLLSGGHRLASHLMARRLEEASGGAVSRSELRPDIWPPVAEAA